MANLGETYEVTTMAEVS